MNATIIAIIVFTCTFGGALLGMRLHRSLPGHHFDADSKDTVKVGIGLIATMTALVLGLVTASAKTSFDAADSAVKKLPMIFSVSTVYLLATDPRPATFVRACSGRLGPGPT